MDSSEFERAWRVEGKHGFNGRLLEALLRQIASGVLLAAYPTGRVLFVNPQMESIWRMPVMRPEDGMPIAQQGYHPSGREYAPEEWPLARALATRRAVKEEEIEIVRGDGTRGFVRMSAVPLSGETEATSAVLVTCLDITEQRRKYTSRRFLSEAGALLSSSLDYVETLRNLARLAVPSLADWCTVYLLDPAGEIERVAIEHADRRKGQALLQLARRFPPTMESDPWVAGVIRSGQPELIAEVTPELLAGFARSPEKRKLLADLELSSVLIVPLVQRGTPLGAIVFATAGSRRRYTEEDLEVADELAARAALAIENARLFDASSAATEAKSDFLAVMSHELRTPLTAIIGYAELLQLGVPDPVTPRQHEQAERIEVSARHLLQLIEEILTLVTLESGERRVRREKVSANEILRRAVAIIGPMARVKNLSLRVGEAEGDPTLDSDADKLLQILLNLLSNAVKFTQSGEIRLNARAAGGSVVFEVIDSGIGMDAEHVRRIFEPFWQVAPAITRSTSGTGLGLTIARRLADLLAARIDVRSEPGKGSTFRLSVPL